MSQEEDNYDDDELNMDQIDEEMDDATMDTVLPPNEFKQNLLNACTTCFLILSKSQWADYQSCPNCNDEVSQRKLTTKFTGITCITNPAKSWQGARMRVVKGIRVKIAGAYAASINEEL